MLHGTASGLWECALEGCTFDRSARFWRPELSGALPCSLTLFDLCLCKDGQLLIFDGDGDQGLPRDRVSRVIRLAPCILGALPQLCGIPLKGWRSRAHITPTCGARVGSVRWREVELLAVSMPRLCAVR
jgi:hypothetical protein